MLLDQYLLGPHAKLHEAISALEQGPVKLCVIVDEQGKVIRIFQGNARYFYLMMPAMRMHWPRWTNTVSTLWFWWMRTGDQPVLLTV